MKSQIQIQIDHCRIIIRQTSERNQEIAKEMMAKKVLIRVHKNADILHVEGMKDSDYIKTALLLKHKNEDNELRITSQRDWLSLLASQKRELSNHTKNNI